MAQTTPDASFGPVFVVSRSAVSAHPVVYTVIRTYIESKSLVSIKKNEQKRKKKLTYGPNDASDVVWAPFH